MAVAKTYDEMQAEDDRRRELRRMRDYAQTRRFRKNWEEYRRNNPIKFKARLAVNRTLRSGRLVKPDNCEDCGKLKKPRDLHGHHDDYAKPLDVRWLCRACHEDWHKNNIALNGDEPMGMMDRFDQFEGKTFGDAADRYLSEFDGKCLARQQYALEPILNYISELRLIDVDDDALRPYKIARTEQVMAGTVNKEIAVAAAVLNKAARVYRWIPTSPKLQRVKGDHRKPYVLSWPQQIAVFSRLCGDIQKICLFAVNTGCRREEIFDLKWKDQIDVDGVTVFVARDTKNGEDRPIICNSIAARIVGYMRDGHFEGKPRPGYVFPKVTVSKILNKAWVMAGLPDEKLVKKGIHNLRHTFGYRLRQAGVTAEDRDALLGHHSRSLTQHYAIPDIRRLADQAELVTVRNDGPVLR